MSFRITTGLPSGVFLTHDVPTLLDALSYAVKEMEEAIVVSVAIHDRDDDFIPIVRFTSRDGVWRLNGAMVSR